MGTFDTLAPPALPGGLAWDASQLYTAGALSVVFDLAGDYNQNGVVDAADYVVWRNTLGQSGSGLAADGNASGAIDPGDYDVWRANFGRAAASSTHVAGSAVPEPAAYMLALLGMSSLVLSRRKSTMRARGRIRSACATLLAPSVWFASIALNPSARADLVTLAGEGTPPSTAAESIHLLPGQTLTTSAAGQIDEVIINNGAIHGPAATGEFLTFTDHVSGAGRYTGNIEFASTFSPGNSPAVVTIMGDSSFGSGHTLIIELGGTAFGQFDRLEVSGNMSLAGMLQVLLLSPFTLSPGQTFEIIEVGGMLSGQFAGLPQGALVGNFSGMDLFISYTAGDGNNVALYTAIPEPTWIAGLGVVLASLRGWWASRPDRSDDKPAVNRG